MKKDLDLLKPAVALANDFGRFLHFCHKGIERWATMWMKYKKQWRQRGDKKKNILMLPEIVSSKRTFKYLLKFLQ